MAKALSRSIRNSVKSQVKKDKDLLVQARLIIEKQFRNVKNQMIRDFQSHPVTRELKAGSGASNITNTLPEGNLYGFIGFQEGVDPISPVSNLLEQTNIFIKNRSIGMHGFIWTYIVTSPSLQELYSSTPMPWSNGASWLREIEGRGIPNLGQYMNKLSTTSRSGAGFQNKNKSSGGMVRIPYIKDILSKFEDNLNSIEASRVSAKNF